LGAEDNSKVNAGRKTGKAFGTKTLKEGWLPNNACFVLGHQPITDQSLSLKMF
jgi:hypothetical protein